MTKPLVMEIPHELGQEEAKRRLVESTERGRSFLARSGINIDTLTWTDNRLDFAVSALAQKVEGQIDVNPETVRLEVRLPLLLALFAEKVRTLVGKEGTLLLTKK